MSDSIGNETLRKLHRLAERLARTREEADDLVQDALVAALEQTRAWDDHGFFAWTSGVVRLRARFVARTAGRRRRRETAYATESGAASPAHARLPGPFIDALPPSLQTIALLANAGLGRAEISHLLGISDAALRKRISDLRKAWKASGADAEPSRSGPPDRPPCGLRRRSMRSALREVPGARFAVADPDGHNIFLGAAHRTPTRGNQ